jgi:hypothetical protein
MVPDMQSVFDKSEFCLLSLMPAGSRRTQAFRHPAASHPPTPRRPSQRLPFMPWAQSVPFTRSLWASCPQPLPALLHWSNPLSVRCWVPPTTALRGSALLARLFSHGWHSSATSDWPCSSAAFLDWRSLFPPWGGASACRSRRRLVPAALVGAGLRCGPRPSLASGRSLRTALVAGECPGPTVRRGRPTGTQPGEAGSWGC